jgi:hypothetical protein
VVKRKNKINDYLKGRALNLLGGVFEFELFLLGLPLFVLLLALQFFLLRDDLLELFLTFWSSSYAS